MQGVSPEILEKNHILKEILSYDNLLKAAKAAIKGKRAKNRYQAYSIAIGYFVFRLREKILSGNYKPRNDSEFDLWCISGQKMRHITVPSLDDSVIQHAIYRVIYPIINRYLIYDSYGCRLDKGTHKAANRCQQFIRASSKKSYCLQMDFSKYYYNLDHSILKSILYKILKEEYTVEFISLQFPKNKDIGMNVGAMLSQLMGIIYLNSYDHYVKRELKVKHYIRYVDDTVYIGLSKKRALELVPILKEFAKNQLHLTFSKIKIFKIKKGINFVGYRAWKNKRIIRKRSMKVFKYNVRNGNIKSINSCLAHAKQTSSYSGMLDYIKHNIRCIQ